MHDATSSILGLVDNVEFPDSCSKEKAEFFRNYLKKYMSVFVDPMIERIFSSATSSGFVNERALDALEKKSQKIPIGEIDNPENWIIKYLVPIQKCLMAVGERAAEHDVTMGEGLVAYFKQWLNLSTKQIAATRFMASKALVSPETIKKYRGMSLAIILSKMRNSAIHAVWSGMKDKEFKKEIGLAVGILVSDPIPNKENSGESETPEIDPFSTPLSVADLRAFLHAK